MRVGDLLGERYQLTGELGRGGFGVVWKAHDRTMGRAVAVKTLRRGGPLSAGDLGRWGRELEILAGLNHPNIVVVFDQGEAVGDGERTSYLVMELLDGPTLAKLIEQGRTELLRGLDIGRQLCAALTAAHAIRVVHRDVKPENIMLVGPERDVVKVLDFGIAQIGDNRDGLTTEGSVIGSTRYLAPERWRGDPGTVRSDLYSVGCVLYELFTGQRPFTSTSAIGLMAQHLDQPPLRPAGLPAELSDLIMRLLAKDPADRPADADEVRGRLGRVADGIRGLRGRAELAWQAAGAGRAAESVSELRLLVPEFVLAFGADDGRTLRTCQDLVIVLERAGEPAEAYTLLTELLAAATLALGSAHPDVADLQRRLDRSEPPRIPHPPGVLAGALSGRPAAVNRTGA